jgi:putative endonuclease
MSNFNDTVLYIGMTNNLIRRVTEHKNHRRKGFTSHYNVTKLVYYEVATTAYSAILREKQLKKWSRVKKESLIDSMNPKHNDLYNDILEGK